MKRYNYWLGVLDRRLGAFARYTANDDYRRGYRSDCYRIYSLPEIYSKIGGGK